MNVANTIAVLKSPIEYILELLVFTSTAETKLLAHEKLHCLEQS